MGLNTYSCKKKKSADNEACTDKFGTDSELQGSPVIRTWTDKETLVQWFPTGVPRHTRVPQRGVRGAAKFWITGFFLMFYYITYHKIVIFYQIGVPPNFLKDLRGAANQKRLKNTSPV